MKNNTQVISNMTIVQNLHTSASWRVDCPVSTECHYVKVRSIIVNGAQTNDNNIYLLKSNLPINDPNNILLSFSGINTFPNVLSPNTLFKLQNKLPNVLQFAVQQDSPNNAVATVGDTKLCFQLEFLKLEN